MADTLTLQADPVVFNAVMKDFVTELQTVFPHRKDQLVQAQQRMDYLTNVNAGAIMRYFKTTMHPFESAVCQEDTGFLLVHLPEIQLLKGKVTQQDIMDARPEDRVMISRTLKNLYCLSVGPQDLPREMLGEMDNVVNAITSDADSVAALEAAFESITQGKEPDPAAMAKLHEVMKKHGMPGLPGSR